uniref:Alpha-1,3-glucosyltransferase n=1 Tax=Noctiluca scintillans TaxID=2966 RepID=A0A7S1AES7_NOCSC|mmetsp:Transcript_43361/g.114174  ORF Transcript_43361/g.114174 Transcript_43361/m.114174 type:complete len:511 (+) Transcript_43361:109-1641(+)
MSLSVNVILAVCLATVLKSSFVFLYRSTDFEVHRNWLAITHSLPFSRWYFEDTSPWTLDYPPFFACFEWALSQVASVVDPQMLVLENLEYASPGTIIFQRATVLFGDLLLVAGVCRAASACAPKASLAAPVALVLFNPALMMVDHIHFQYNGMMLGILLLSAGDIATGRAYRGSMLFCILLNMKQIFLYVAPVYFVYLLRDHCGFFVERKFPFVQLRIRKLVCLGAVVIATFAAAWTPLLLTGQVMQTVSRLFPFGRGLTHAYWAPNVWALYNTADRGLAKFGFGAQNGHSSTGGFAEVYESSVLWTIPPKATLALVVAGYLPLLVLIWRRTSPRSRTENGNTEFLAVSTQPRDFVFYVALGNAVAFSLGWHVHEKAILMVTVPLLACVSRLQEISGALDALSVLSLVATFSVLPLLPQSTVERSVKWMLFVVGHIMELRLLHHRRNIDFRLICMVFVAMVFLGWYHDFGGHAKVFGERMEFLPLLLISDFCAVFVLASFVRMHVLVARK